MERRRNCDGDFVQMVNKILVIPVIFVIPIIFHDIKKKKKKRNFHVESFSCLFGHNCTDLRANRNRESKSSRDPSLGNAANAIRENQRQTRSAAFR